MAENNTKRKFSAGIFVMLAAALIILVSGYYQDAVSGCAGDCMTCHPKLIGDINHLSLTTCIKCHKPVTDKTFSLSQGGCGDRCFQCHEEWPKDGNHASLNTCLNCHEK